MGDDELDLPLSQPPQSEKVADAKAAYASHRDYLKRAAPAADDRAKIIREKALDAFKDYIREERCLIIHFADMNATELGRILAKYPSLAKPLMILCGVAERAIERDQFDLVLPVEVLRLSAKPFRRQIEILRIDLIPDGVSTPLQCRHHCRSCACKRVKHCVAYKAEHQYKPLR